MQRITSTSWHRESTPISGQEVPEDSVINQARLVRCFFYVSGVLERVIDNGGRIERAAGVKGPFSVDR